MLKQFIVYCMVGASGVVINGIVFFSLKPIFGTVVAWFIGVESAVITNFILNKIITFGKYGKEN